MSSQNYKAVCLDSHGNNSSSQILYPFFLKKTNTQNFHWEKKFLERNKKLERIKLQLLPSNDLLLKTVYVMRTQYEIKEKKKNLNETSWRHSFWLELSHKDCVIHSVINLNALKISGHDYYFFLFNLESNGIFRERF